MIAMTPVMKIMPIIPNMNSLDLFSLQFELKKAFPRNWRKIRKVVAYG